MLIIAGTITIDPDRREEFDRAAREMMRETHKEAGNLVYCFTHDLEDESLVRIFEQWETQEALDAHFKAPHMAAFQKAMGQVGMKDMSIQRFEIASVSKLL